jgi:hypothetical protein
MGSMGENNIHVHNNQWVVWILSSRIKVIHKVYLGWAPGLFGQLFFHVQSEYICKCWLEEGRKVEDWNTLIGREREKEKKDIDEWGSLVYWKQDQKL